ncbi:MAG TPA: hypothetical protein VG898_06700 [Solirubrobacterales bacterium]|nr:hypothetical protein [Solirubrobacterales bacterium]
MSAPVPALAPGAVPPQIRAEGTQAVASFRAALGFEKVLIDKLLSEALPSEEGGPQAASLPETLADAIVSAGGAGIATGIFAAPGTGR